MIVYQIPVMGIKFLLPSAIHGSLITKTKVSLSLSCHGKGAKLISHFIAIIACDGVSPDGKIIDENLILDNVSVQDNLARSRLDVV